MDYQSFARRPSADEQDVAYDQELATASAALRQTPATNDDDQQQHSSLFHPVILPAVGTMMFVGLASAAHVGWNLGSSSALASASSSSSAGASVPSAVDPMSMYLTGEIGSDMKETLFQSFKDKFRADEARRYTSDDEEASRFSIFQENIDRIAMLNAANGHDEDGPMAMYGINVFADLTPDEFKATYLMPDAWANGNSMAGTLSGHGGGGGGGGGGQANSEELFDGICRSCVAYEEIDTLTSGGEDLSSVTDFDWRDYDGVVSAVQNQGYCGSCWSFGTTGDIEGTWKIATGETVKLSEQQLVSCDTQIDMGCNGGVQEYAFEYIMEAGGLVSDELYPYVSGDAGQNPVCREALLTEDNFAASIEGWQVIAYNAVDGSEEAMLEALIKSGPITVAVNADPEQFYVGGIDDPADCDPMGLDHAVLAVGFGEEDGIPYWIIKNSWSDEWGEDGYYRLLRNSNTCGIAMDVVHSVVTEA